MRGAQLGAGVHPAVLAAQPLSVQQAGPGQFRAELGPAQPVDRLAVLVLGGAALAGLAFGSVALAGLAFDGVALAWPSTVWPSLSSAWQRARIPRPKSVPPARVKSASRSNAAAATDPFPLRTAASISSGSAHIEM